jgi:[lysine-biosynthesis-protein LysW]---L-2-aminoadipate ligase
MSKICIVFDRLRLEEKLLQKEATTLGHDTSMLDAKLIQINTNSKKNDFDLGDVVLERCISYFRGLHFTACLNFLDVPVVNEFDVANNCGNKMFMTLLLKKHNVPTPKTYFSFSKDGAQENIDDIGFPLVIKPVIGSWGRGVMLVKDRDTLDAIFEIRQFSDGPHDRLYYFQELINRPPRDIRVISVGSQAIAAMYRKSDGGFKTNIALGAEPELCKITNEMEDLVAKTSKAMGGGILGVDIMEDEKRGLLVHEVNNTVEFKGLVKVAEKNIPREMIEFILNSIRK